MRVLDLFSGIGGFSLGLERAGMTTVAFCEIDPFCRRVLAKHWPHVPVYEDVKTLTAGRLAADGIAVDVICGGFPCQDISVAGKGEGIDGARSGLWSEYARLVGELRPGHVIVENVAALLGRGLDRVLGDLASLGYDAEWYGIPASAVGAPHRRDRIWIVAYPADDGAGRGSNSRRAAKARGMRPTPRATDGSHGGRVTSRKSREGGNLVEAVSSRMFPTPTARDWRSGKASATTMAKNARPLSEAIGGSLNPTWVEWLMGFPAGWTDCGGSATPSSRKSRKPSAAP